MIRPASTLCLLRGGEGALDVLMVRRATSSVFVGGAHVFPGGAVDAIDRSAAARRVVTGVDDPEMVPWVAAALRETAEEAGVLVATHPAPDLAGVHGADLYERLAERGVGLDGGRLAYLSNWVTPEGQPRRFDTRFFVAAARPDSPSPRPDGHEVTEAHWISPTEALARSARGEWLMIPPTVETLRLLARFDSPAAVVEHARTQEQVPRFEPRMIVRADGSMAVRTEGPDGVVETELP